MGLLKEVIIGVCEYMKDDVVTIKSLKHNIKTFCENRDWDQFHNPKDLAIGISTEANELLDLFRFKSESEIKKMIKDINKRKAIGEELADVFYFVIRFAQMNDFDLSGELQKKIKENEKKYPISKARGSNKKYNEA
jgi:NTP pyrophosphatase (non-canonical NTP hydrolase)